MTITKLALAGLCVALAVSVTSAACNSDGWYSISGQSSPSGGNCFSPGGNANADMGNNGNYAGNFNSDKDALVFDCASGLQGGSTNFALPTEFSSLKRGGCGETSYDTAPFSGFPVTLDASGYPAQFYMYEEDGSIDDGSFNIVWNSAGAMIAHAGAQALNFGSLTWNNDAWMICDNATFIPNNALNFASGSDVVVQALNDCDMSFQNEINFGAAGSATVTVDSTSVMDLRTKGTDSRDRGFLIDSGTVSVTVDGTMRTSDSASGAIAFADTVLTINGLWETADDLTVNNTATTISSTGALTTTGAGTWTGHGSTTLDVDGDFNVDHAITLNGVTYSQGATGSLNVGGGSLSTDGSFDLSGATVTGFGDVNHVDTTVDNLELRPSGGVLALNAASGVFALGGSDNIDVYIDLGSPSAGSIDSDTHDQQVDLTGLISSIGGSAGITIHVTDSWSSRSDNEVVTFEDVLVLFTSYTENDISLVVESGPACSAGSNLLHDSASGLVSVQCGSPCDDAAAACPTPCQQTCAADADDLSAAVTCSDSAGSCQLDDCQLGPFTCNAGVCEGNGDRCSAPTPICRDVTPLDGSADCEQCLVDTDCNGVAGRPLCDPTLFFCQECLTEDTSATGDGACPGDSQCVSKSCVECRNDVGCASQPNGFTTCNLANNTCSDCYLTDAGCDDDACNNFDCVLNVPTGEYSCVANYCAAWDHNCEPSRLGACACPGDPELVSPLGCFVDGDCCGEGDLDACDSDNICKDCRDDIHSFCEAGEQCDGNVCVDCVDDGGCASDQQCDTVNKVCVDCVNDSGCSTSPIGTVCLVAENRCVECLGLVNADDEAACGCTDGGPGQNCGCDPATYTCVECDEDRGSGTGKDCLTVPHGAANQFCQLDTFQCVDDVDPCVNNPCVQNTTCYQEWCEPLTYPLRTCHPVFADAGVVCEGDNAQTKTDDYCDGIDECDGLGACVDDNRGPFDASNICQAGGHPRGGFSSDYYCSEVCEECLLNPCRSNAAIRGACSEIDSNACLEDQPAGCTVADFPVQAQCDVELPALCDYSSLVIPDDDPCRLCSDLPSPSGVCGDVSDNTDDIGYCSGEETCQAGVCQHNNRIGSPCNLDDDVCTTSSYLVFSLDNDVCVDNGGSLPSTCQAGSLTQCEDRAAFQPGIGCNSTAATLSENDVCVTIEACAGTVCPSPASVGPCWDPNRPATQVGDDCCVYTAVAAGFGCDNGVFCDGKDECDGNGECVSAGSPCEGCTEEEQCPAGLGAFAPLLGALGGAVVVGGVVLIAVRQRLGQQEVKTVVKKKSAKDGASTLDKYKKKEKSEEKEPLTGGGKKITINEDANKKAPAGKKGPARKPSVGEGRKGSKSPAARRPSTGSEGDKKGGALPASARPGRRPSKSPARAAARGGGGGGAKGGSEDPPAKPAGGAGRGGGGPRRPSQGRAKSGPGGAAGGNKGGAGGNKGAAAAALPGPAPKKVPPRKRTNSVSRSISFKEKGRK